MEFPLTAWRAEHVDALLRGERQAGTPEDVRVLAAVTALSVLPPPAVRPDFHAELRARLLGDALLGDAPGVDSVGVATEEAASLPAGRNGRRAPGRVVAGRRVGVPPRRRAGRFARPVLVGALTSSVAVIGVVVAADDARPGEPLYGVKRRVEQIQVTLAGDELRRAQARLELARTRMSEMRALVADSGPGNGDLPELLHAWREQADLGTDVLLDRALAGSADAHSTMVAFTAEQSGELVELLRMLPGDGEVHRAATTALVFIEVVDAGLGVAEANLPEDAGSPGAPPGGGSATLPSSTATAATDGTPSPSSSPSAAGHQAPRSGPAPDPTDGAPSVPAVPALPFPPGGAAPPPQVPATPSPSAVPGYPVAPQPYLEPEPDLETFGGGTAADGGAATPP